MRLFELPDTTNVLREFRSDVKDAEFVKWIAISSKMREEVNQLLKIMKKMIKKTNKNSTNNEKLKIIVKDLVKNNNDTKKTVNDLIRISKNAEFIHDNPVIVKLNENIKSIEDSLYRLTTSQVLKNSPVVSDIYEKLSRLEGKIDQLKVADHGTLDN